MANNGTRTAQQILGLDSFVEQTKPGYAAAGRDVDAVVEARADEHADQGRPVNYTGEKEEPTGSRHDGYSGRGAGQAYTAPDYSDRSL